MELDLRRVEAALERELPELKPLGRLSWLGGGFRSQAVETADGLVFKVGRSADAAQDYEREWRVGGFLAAQIGGGLVPVPLCHVGPAQDLPYGALAYRKLPGANPEWRIEPGANFARELGRFMAELHAVPVEEARVAGVPEVDAYQRMLGAREVVLPVLRQRVVQSAFEKIEGWWAGFTDDRGMTSSRRAVCHHDLWHGNLLQSEGGHLSGVLDLAHVEIADPAHDFAAPRYFGESFMAELQSAYRESGGVLSDEDMYRADRFWQSREFGGLAWAIEHDDQAEVDEAIGKILRGPLFTASL